MSIHKIQPAINVIDEIKLILLPQATNSITHLILMYVGISKNVSTPLRDMRLTLIGMSLESKKNAYLWRLLGASFIRLNKLGRLSN